MRPHTITTRISKEQVMELIRFDYLQIGKNFVSEHMKNMRQTARAYPISGTSMIVWIKSGAVGYYALQTIID